MEAERSKVDGNKRSLEETVEDSAPLKPRTSSFRKLKKYGGHIQEEEKGSYKFLSSDSDLSDGEPRPESIRDIELEESEEEGGLGRHSSRSGPGNNIDSINVSIDHHVLDCSYCHKPLRAPLFECDDGHVACSLCCAILKNKCHVCSLPTGSRRCRALEAVIEAMKISCPNYRFGCLLTISYTQKYTHEKSCPFAPCSCPISSCTFRETTELLLKHIHGEHHSTTPLICFYYNRSFKVALRQKVPFLVLHGKDGRIFLLLNECNTVPYGNSLSVACMRPGSMESDLGYKITVKGKGRGSELHLQASPKNIRELKVGSPAESFLFVPHGICDSSGVISVDVLIRKM